MNWILRLKNKATLTAIIAGLVAFVYQVLGWVGIMPQISADDIVNAAGTLINLLVLIGVVVDPTTDGIKDTETVMEYSAPRKED